MFAKVTRFNIGPESLKQGHHQIEEHLIPAVRMQKGYSGLLLANKEDHKMLAVTLWEDDQEMHATDEASHWFRVFGAEAFDGKVKDSRPMRSIALDWIIQSRDRTQPGMNDVGDGRRYTTLQPDNLPRARKTAARIVL